jgi:hypothetical protein
MAQSCPKCGAPVALHLTPAAEIADKPKSSSGGWILIFIVVGLIVTCSMQSSGPPRQKEPSLNAIISHRGATFVITNNDSYDWQDCDLDLNSDYRLKTSHIGAGRTVEVPAGQFAKADGTRFNWMATKPLQLFVYCRRAPTGTRSTMVGWK